MATETYLEQLYKAGLARPRQYIHVYRSGWMHAYDLFAVQLEGIDKLEVVNGKLRCTGDAHALLMTGIYKFDAHEMVNMLKRYKNEGVIEYPFFIQGAPFVYDKNEMVGSPIAGVASWFVKF